MLYYEVTTRGVEPERFDGKAELIAQDGDRLLLRTPDLETAEKLVSSCLECGGRVVSMVPSRETLEDMFLDEISRAGDRGAG